MNPLTGRENLLPTLDSHMDAVARGSGGCLVIEGPFGTGKTHLLKALSLEAAERGMTVAAGEASGTDRPAPLHLLINLLRHIMPGEADFEDLVRPDRNPFWLVDRVGELVESAARRRPLVFVLDDAQRIDDAGGLALRGLVQSLAPSPVLWLLARRPVPAPSLGQHALGWLIDHAAVRLALGALDDEAVAEMCTGILGADPDASVLRWAARCGGNPWLLENLFNAFRRAGHVVVVDGTASVMAERLPEGFPTAVGSLLDGMSPAVRRLLVSGRRIGRTFTAEDVAAALGESVTEPSSLSASVEEAVHVGLVHRDGEELTITHEVVAEALLQPSFQEWESAAAVASAASACDGRALGGPQPAGLPSPVPGGNRAPAGVADASARQPDAAVPVVTPAAPAAAQPPGCGCEDLAARAMSALGDVFDDVPRTVAVALRLLAGAGRSTESVRLARVALRPGVEAAAEAQLVRELSQGLRDAGCHGVSAGLLQRTLTRQDIDEAERAALRTALAETAQCASGAPAAVTAPWGGRPTALASPLLPRRDGGSGDGTRAGADGLVTRVPRHAMSPAHCGACERPLWTWLVRALVAADLFDEATAVCQAVKQEAERFGEAWPETLWYGHHAELLAAAGRIEEARGEAEAALRLADRSAAQDSVPARLVLARLSMHRGDLATASDQLRMTERLTTGAGQADKARLDWALAHFHAASGRPAMMVRTLIDTDGKVEPDPLLFTEVPTAAAMLVRLAGQAGLGAEAERAAEFARHIAERNPAVRSLVGSAEHAEGVLRNDMVALHRAVELHRHAARPLAAGSALEDAARVEQDMGNRTRTVRLLESALDLYLDCGAQRDTARVQKKLRRLGVHHERGPGAERPKSGWESLTSAELRVVRAIVDGKTNREAASSLFLSPHTVDSHLRRVFSKLDINSRVELTRHFLAHEALSSGGAASQRPGSAV
ncbi:LuxR family transcriptional regulator [Streptomyces sp. NK08204]|uniref:helix-turn-helix transcriptional regulator n=1 Tax=Streptomyces sp. NK08204 TaxID=2873260 RepID=UPI001CED533F